VNVVYKELRSIHFNTSYLLLARSFSPFFLARVARALENPALSSSARARRESARRERARPRGVDAAREPENPGKRSQWKSSAGALAHEKADKIRVSVIVEPSFARAPHETSQLT
jgi:hypothetical protein